ncbi:MAG: hypothetical protein FJZ95_00075, partial [Chloroflexi bacterium]|nr:hypothetical protein [Chloroflexota bacterium]
MKILAFSDWRTQPLQMIENIVKLERPDVILYAGDDLHRLIPLGTQLLLKTPSHLIRVVYPSMELVSKKDGKLFAPEAKRLLQEMHSSRLDTMPDFGVPFRYITGNDDLVLSSKGRYYVCLRGVGGAELHRLKETRKGHISVQRGLSLSARCEIYAPIIPSFGWFEISIATGKVSVFGTRCEFGLHGEIKNPPSQYADIFLSHLPPLGVLDLSHRFGTEHIGSKKLRNAVARFKPKLAICGHSHAWGGHVADFDSTKVVNVSSHDRDNSPGNYAILDTNDWSVQIKSVTPKPLLSIRGARDLRKEIPDLATQQMFDSVSNPSEFLRCLEKLEEQGMNTTTVKERVQSLEWASPEVKRPITFNPRIQAFVDVETGLANGSTPGTLRLIGLCYEGQIHQFLIPEEKDQFLNYIRENQISSLASWTLYDRDSLLPMFEDAGISMRFIDVCQRVGHCIPWHTYELSRLHTALFAQNSNQDTI